MADPTILNGLGVKTAVNIFVFMCDSIDYPEWASFAIEVYDPQTESDFSDMNFHI